MAITVRKLSSGWAVFVDGKQQSPLSGKATANLRAQRVRINKKLNMRKK